MNKGKLKKNVKKALCLSMALAMATNGVPSTTFFSFDKAIVKAADSTVTIDSSAIVQQINDVNRPGIPDGVLLNELKRLVNTQLGRSATNDITFAELMAYNGEIDLSAIGSTITSISGLGYARKASKIVLTNVPITAIPDYEFDGCTGLQEIVLPTGLTTLGKFSFRNCNKLSKIVLPETVTSIGESAFDACVSLGSLNIPDAVTNISKGAFGGCTALETMSITNKNVVLGASVFEGCTNLTTVSLPEGITSIPASFFASSGIKEITVPTTVTEISQSAFNATYSLNSVDLSKCTALKTIGTSAFAVSGLSKIELPNGLLTIKGNAFEGCGLTQITIPDTVVGAGDGVSEGGIEHHAFWNCQMLESVSLPAGVSKLQEKVFSQCHSLKKVEIRNPENSILESIETQAFSECYNLTNTDFLKNLKNLKTIGKGAFEYYVTGSSWHAALKLIVSNNGKDMCGEDVYPQGLQSISLPDSLTSFDATAFNYQYNVQSIDFGNGITEIPDKAFSGFVRLTTINFPEYLKKVGNSSFAGCYKIESLQFPQTLETIGPKAFSGCGAVKKINNVAYHVRYVLKGQIYDARPAGNTTATECLVFDENAVYGQQIQEKVIDLSGALTESDYEKLESAQGYEKCLIIGQKRYVDPSVFTTNSKGATKYTSYNYDAQKQEIADVIVRYSKEDIFASEDNLLPKEGCVGLYLRGSVVNMIHARNYYGVKDIVLPNSVKEVGESAFENCYNVRTITLSNQLNTIANSSFAISDRKLVGVYDWLENESIAEQYAYMRTINFSPNIITIGDKAFYNNANLLLPNGKLPDALELIGVSSFEQCRSITALVVPSKTEKIEKRAFYGCSEYVELEGRISSYTNYQMKANKGLQEIDLTQANSLESIGSYAFALTPIIQCTIPQKVTLVRDGLFQDCHYLKKVICSDNTTEIKDLAFSNCGELVSITVPAKSTISYRAFAGYKIGEFSFSVTDPEPISVSIGEIENLPINTFLSKYLRDALVVTEKDGQTGLLEIAESTTEKVNGLEVARANVKGVKEGTTRISVVGTNNYEAYDSYVISKAPEVIITVNVTKKKCEAIEDTTDRAVVSVENTSQDVRISPKVLPVDCTEQNVWLNGNDSVLSVLPETYVKDGVTLTSSSAIVSPKTLGTSKVTLKCGSVKKDYQVNVVIPATSLSLKENAISLKEGKKETATLSAVMTYDTTKYTQDMWNNYGDILEYSSADEKIATVSSDGVITPVSAGITTITVTALGSRRSVTCNVTVLPDETMVSFTDENGVVKKYENPINVQAKEPLKLNFATNPEDSLREITYEFTDLTTKGMFSYVNSETKKVETTDKGIQDKVVAMTFTGEKIGSGTITILPRNCKNKEMVSASVKVNVIADTKEVAFAPITKVVVGEQASVFGYLTTALGTAEKIEDLSKITTDQVSFRSSNPLVATVDEKTGQVTAIAEGNVKVSMLVANPYNAAKSMEQTLELAITRPMATNVLVAEKDSKSTVEIGGSLQLVTTLVPVTAADSVSFESLTPEIASVDQTGKITAVAAGAGRIKVTTSGKAVSTEFEFTVINNGTGGSQVGETPSQNVKVAKVTNVTLKNVKGKKLKITWKKIAGASGYRIIYAKNSKCTKGKKVVSVKKNITTKQITKLKKGTTYYVKVQAYKVVDGKKVYGKYSAVKKIKIKK